MLEFTGERVVPGLVDPNLFNEHLARYRFAARFAANLEQALKPGPRVLDAGCGSGYGAAEFPDASVVGMDFSAAAIAHARRAFSRPGLHFLQGACESLPFSDASFDLLLAFEVIEHLERWREMLTEARRVLRPAGVLLVSTPNKAWYAESRAAAGPNPYHVHEFEYREFEAALTAVFPHVQLWSQNHSEAIAFVPASPSDPSWVASADNAASPPEHAHFFLALCSQSPIAESSAFAWLPSTGNVLRERQRHISLLESEVEQKSQWLAGLEDAQARLQTAHEHLLAELRERNAWADRLNGELDLSRARVAELQWELHAAQTSFQEHLSRLETEAAARVRWARDLEAEIERGTTEIERLNGEFDERTRWALSLDRDLQGVRAELHAIKQIPLIRVARKLHLIPGKSQS